jgi:hypothetical protein
MSTKAIVDYNDGMGGNDVGDMLRSRSTMHGTSKKWWRGIFCYCEDETHIATYRSWNSLVPSKLLTMRKTIEQIFLGLIGETSSLITSVLNQISQLNLRLELPTVRKKRVRVNAKEIETI